MAFVKMKRPRPKKTTHAPRGTKSNKASPKTKRFWEEWEAKGFDPEKRRDAGVAAGYPPGKYLAANVQTAINTISNNPNMQAALRKKGVNVDFIADRLKKNIEAKKPYYDKEKEKTVMFDDTLNQNKALEMAINAIDGFPAKKQEVDINQKQMGVIVIKHEDVTRGKNAIEREVKTIDDIRAEFLE
jgi:hypothetical protein